MTGVCPETGKQVALVVRIASPNRPGTFAQSKNSS